MSRPLVTVVVAARPNFMKAGPVVEAIAPEFDVDLVHTGQHYDRSLSGSFLEELELPDPAVNLGVGSGSHGAQTAAVLAAFEAHLVESRPDAVLVVGDVNSTLAAGLAAVKLHIPVGHVEAGLRSRDWTMPEEVNRILTDHLSCWLFTPSPDADENLRAEGIGGERIHLVGNVMIDTLMRRLDQARSRFEQVATRLGVASGEYGILTLHRPATVDVPAVMARALTGVGRVAQSVPILFAVHPRTTARLAEAGHVLPDGVIPMDPLGYLDFLALMDGAAVILTDSGGMQEEAAVLGVPCLTLRPSTERPITVELGTNIVVGTDPDVIAARGAEALATPRRPAEIPLWDGAAAPRIATVLSDAFAGGGPGGPPGLCRAP